MTTSDEALGFCSLELQSSPCRKGGLIYYHYFLHSLLASVFKTLAAENVQSTQFMKNGGGCKNSHSESFFQQNLKPLCTRIIAFTVLFAVIHKITNNHIKKIKREIKDCIFKSHHNNPIYYHPFRHFLYITYLHIRPIFFPKESVEK